MPDRPVDNDPPPEPDPVTYPNGYGYKTRIVGPALAGTLTNFQLRFDMTQAGFKSVANSGTVAFENGQDFRFELADGTKLPHHLTSYDPATGRVRGFVRVASLSSELEFFLYTGNATLPGTEENKAGTYQDAIVAWDARTGEDLTAKGADRTLTPTTVGTATVIEDAGNYNGTSSFAANTAQPTWLDGHAAVTIMCFVDPADSGNTDGAIIAIGPPDLPHDSGLGACIRWDVTGDSGAANTISAKIHATSGASRVEGPANSQFTTAGMLALTWAAGAAAKLYKDGVQLTPSNTPAAPTGTTTFSRANTASRVYLGRNLWTTAANVWWSGAIDEVRIYASEFSAARLAAMKTNYFRPDLEHGFGVPVAFGATEGPVPTPMSDSIGSGENDGVMDLTTFAPALPAGGTPLITAAAVTSGGGSVAITGSGTSITYTRPIGGAATSAEGTYTITVDGRVGHGKFFVTVAAAALATTYANGYSYRTKFVLPGTSNKNPPTITNYIMRLDETFAGWKSVANGGHVENGTHLDFRVETTGGTKWDHDVTTYTPTTGHAVMEIRVPTFGTDNIEFYVYSGKAGLGATEEATVTPPGTPGNTRLFNLAFPHSFLGRGVPVAANDTALGPIAMPDEDEIRSDAPVGTTVDLTVLANDVTLNDIPKTLSSVSGANFTASGSNVRFTKVAGLTYPIEGVYTISAEGKTATGYVLIRERIIIEGGGPLTAEQKLTRFTDHKGPMENGRPLFMATFEQDPNWNGNGSTDPADAVRYRCPRSQRQFATGGFHMGMSGYTSFMGNRPAFYGANCIAYLDATNRVNSWQRLAGGPTWTPPNNEGQATFNDSLVSGFGNVAYYMPNINHNNLVGTNAWGYDRTMACGMYITTLPFLTATVTTAQQAAAGNSTIINWWKAYALRLKKMAISRGNPIIVLRPNWEGMNQDTGLKLSAGQWYDAGMTQNQYNEMMYHFIATVTEYGPSRLYIVFSPAFVTTKGGNSRTYESYLVRSNGDPVGYTGACASFHPDARRLHSLAHAQQSVNGGSHFPEGAFYPIKPIMDAAHEYGIPFMSLEHSGTTPFGNDGSHGNSNAYPTSKVTAYWGDAYESLGIMMNDAAHYGYTGYFGALDSDMVSTGNTTCVLDHTVGANVSDYMTEHRRGGNMWTAKGITGRNRCVLAFKKYFGYKPNQGNVTIPARDD